MRIIDSHHHFWQYDPVEYAWIDEGMSTIRRDFLPPDLRQEINDAGVNAVVSVQARQSLAETEWLLEMAGEHQFIAGVVGWLPLQDEAISGQLERFASYGKLVSVRHVVQGEADDDFILRPDFNRGISALSAFDLTYDILILEKHLPQTIEFVDQHPGQRFVLDHSAKPRIRENVIEPWRMHIGELAKRENVWCKLSGLVTEADCANWTTAQLQPYIETVLEAFGVDRVMFGSDWPVCLVACRYREWLELVLHAVSRLSETEQMKIMGCNAVNAYKLILPR